MISAHDALERLQAGNRRFVSGHRQPDSARPDDPALQAGQSPFAVILGCSDSRVPVEIVFDQGLGDLFVIRVAGNVVTPSQLGSVEFAARAFGTRLVVVLGHTGCGAVRATLDALLEPTASDLSANLESIVSMIRPALEAQLVAEPELEEAELLRAVGRANVRRSVEHLRHDSVILEELIEEDGLLVVGAEYDLASGEVEFFDGVSVQIQSGTPAGGTA